MNKSTIITLGVIALLVIFGLSLYGYVNGVYNEGVGYEQQLTAQYPSCQNNLSAYTNGFYEQFGVYAVNLKGLDKFMQDAVKGRYDNRNAAGNPTGTINASLFVNAIAEQYPDTSAISGLAGKLMDYVQSHRQDFKDCQDKLLDMIRGYNTYRLSGLVHRSVVSMLGFPSNNLVARIGTDTWTGNSALDKMSQIVLSSDAINAYQTGVQGPLQVPTLQP